jgi:hypothetical protein
MTRRSKVRSEYARAPAPRPRRGLTVLTTTMPSPSTNTRLASSHAYLMWNPPCRVDGVDSSCELLAGERHSQYRSTKGGMIVIYHSACRTTGLVWPSIEQKKVTRQGR